MTNTDTVERLRELLGKATEGPWYLEPAATTDGLAWIGDGRQHGMYPIECEAFEAELIVDAINALPALLDAVEALEWYASQETYADGPSVSDVAWAPEIPALSDRGQRARTALATLKGEG